jgi:hypothetical protein
MKNILTYIILLLFMACSNAKTVQGPLPTGGNGGGVFDKQGHRGCRGLMPENTMPAMLYALGLGVTMVWPGDHYKTRWFLYRTQGRKKIQYLLDDLRGNQSI